jgi:hypothetical protein
VIGHNSAGGWGVYGAASGAAGPGAGVEAFSSNTDPALRASVDTAATGATVMELYNSDGRLGPCVVRASGWWSGDCRMVDRGVDPSLR